MQQARSPGGAAAPRSFGALRHRGFGAYFALYTVAMMADNVEHVISYWMMFQKFHSPALGGFAVLSHWLPLLFFGVYSGALADRYDPRRIIQIGMLLFAVASAGWGLFFWTDTLEVWKAMLLLVIHGSASLLWQPASQVLIHDIVGMAELPSAVRLIATARFLGLLLGPAAGAGIMLLFGPTHGIMLNVLFYAPMVIWLWRAPYGPRFRQARGAPARQIRGGADIVATLRTVAAHPVLSSMTLLAGCASLFVGNAYQAQMPEFAQDLGHVKADITYSFLLAADAAGALLAGIVLESRGLLRPRPQTAFVLAALWCCVIAGFAWSGSYPLSLVLLFAAGFLELSFNAMTQALVQMNAPDASRGRVIGLYNMAALGLRAFSGVTVGLLGSVIGIHVSLSSSALILLGVICLLLVARRRAARAAGQPPPSEET